MRLHTFCNRVLPTLLIGVSLSSLSSFAAGYDIYLYSLSQQASIKQASNNQDDHHSKWTVSAEAKAVTDRDGYDNQPSFTPDSQAIVFASDRAEGQNDIYRYQLDNETLTRLTHTLDESEYSPSLSTSLRYVVEQGVPHQSVWQQVDQAPRTRAINSMIPSGYYAYKKGLGTLLWARYAYSLYFEPEGEQADERHFVVSNAGRSIHPMPSSNAFSYLHKQQDGEWVIKRFSPLENSHQAIIALTGGSEDYAWSQDNWLFNFKTTPQGQQLRAAHYQGTPIADWQELITLQAPTSQHSHASRIALAPDGKHIAVVWVRQ